MWTTGATHMIARVTGSTLFANSNVTSIFGFDNRSISTINDQTSSLLDKNDDQLTVIRKMRDLRALTPYAHFVKDKYNEISKQNPNLKMIELSKKLSEAWKTLSNQEKQVYFKKTEAQKEAYEKERNLLSPVDLQILDEDGKTRRIENRVKKSIQNLPTKKPRSSFMHFLATLDRGEAALPDFMRGAAKIWARLPEQEKQKFEALYLEEKQNYTQALITWATKNKLASDPKVQESTQSISIQNSDDVVNVKSSSHKKAIKKRSSTSRKKDGSASKSSSKKSSEADDSESSSSDSESSSKLK